MPAAVAPDAQSWKSPEGRTFAFSSATGGDARIEVPGVAVYRAPAGATEVEATPVPGADVELVESLFRRFVRPIVLQFRGAEVLHASAVDSEHGVVAFIGPSQAGKSTLAAAIGAEGVGVWADDTLVWAIDEGEAQVAASEFQPRVRPEVASLGLRPAALVSHGTRLFRAIYVLEAGPPDVRVAAQRMAPALAARELLAQAFSFQLSNPERSRTMVARYLRLAAQVSVFTLTVPRSLHRLEDTAREVVRLVGRR